MLTYKNYVGHVVFDDEAEIFHGEVINTRDVITFQGKTVEEIKRSFIDSIEDYLSFCVSRNEEPDKPFSGKFNLRIDPETHKEAYIAAKKSGESLNAWVTGAILHSLEYKNGDSRSHDA
jgi:predicted HicB family RNase H-like nuclease